MELSGYFIVLGIFDVILAFIVFLKNYKTRANVLFFGVAISLALWTFSWYFLVSTGSIFWARLTFVWGGFILSFYWLIGFYFLNKKKINRFFISFLMSMNLLIIIFSMFTDHIVKKISGISSLGYLSQQGSLQPFYRLFLGMGMIFAVTKIFRRIRSGKSIEQKAKLKWIFTGTLLFSIFAAFSSAIGPFLLGKTNITGLGPLASFPYLLFFAIAIVKYRISDIKGSLYKGVLRFATISFLFAALALPISTKTGLNYLLSLNRTTLFIIIWVVIYIIYLYARYFIPLIDRFFSKKEFNIYKKVSEFRQSLINAANYKDVSNLTRDILEDKFDYKVNELFIFSIKKEKILKKNSGLDFFLIQNNHIYELEFLLLKNELDPYERSIQKLLNEKKSKILIPFIFQKKLYAIAFLDSDKINKLLSSFDLTILNIVREEVSNVFHRISLLRKLTISEAKEFYAHELKKKNDELTNRNRIIERDIDLAKKIQEKLIPVNPEKFKNLSIDTKFIPADKIAGDFFDIFRFNNNKIGVFIGDVSGHGVPAALIASMAKIVLTSFDSDTMLDPASVLKLMNQKLIDSMNYNFITVFYGIIDMNECSFTYSGAAHPPQFLFDKKSKTFKKLQNSGKAIGVIKNSRYKNLKIDIIEGSRFFLFTDGCFEVFNRNGEMYGEKRLLEFFKKTGGSEIKSISNKLMTELKSYSGSKKLDDDFTLIILELDEKK